jgi:acyl-CoA thioesterase-1
MLHPAFIKNTIAKIVEHLQRSGVAVLLAGMQPVTDVGDKYRADFTRIYNEIAEEHNILLIPSILAGVAGNPRLNLKDGIHPTEEGHRIIADTTYPYLLEALGKK